MTEILTPARERPSAPESGGLRALLDLVGEGLLRLEDGHVAWANRAAARIAGLEEPEELVGRSAAALLEAEAGGRLPGPPPDAVECGLRQAEGGTRPVAVRALGDATGATIWVIREAGLEARLAELEGELKASRERASALAKQLERGAGERDELLGVVSHELRTPVTVIAGFSRLLLSEQAGPLNSDQRRFLEESARSCRRLDAFIGNLLEGARTGASARPLALRDASLLETIEGIVTFLSPLLAERDLRVELDVPTEADRAWFDPEPIEQVLTNLLGNALKYSPPGATIRLVTQRAGADQVRVAVSDSGPGIPEEQRERIFQPWVRVGAGQRSGGLGLGLAICRQIVEDHGGTIGVEPAREGGSCFFFSLPVRAPAGGHAG